MKSIGITLNALILFSCSSKNKEDFNLEEATVEPGYIYIYWLSQMQSTKIFRKFLTIQGLECSENIS
jgi:uncharacterized membrane protein (DUF106 family)